MKIIKVIGTLLAYMIDFIGIIGSILYLREIPESMGIRFLLVFLVMHLAHNVGIFIRNLRINIEKNG